MARDNDNPWGDLARPDRTLGAGTPTREERETRAELERQYQALGPGGRAAAGIQNIINSMPLVRRIPGVTTALSTPENTEIATRARPWLSGAERFVGSTTPYVAAATRFPRAFQTFPRSATIGGLTEATDVGLGGGSRADIYSAGALGVGGAGVGWGLGRLLRNPTQPPDLHRRAERVSRTARDENRRLDADLNPQGPAWQIPDRQVRRFQNAMFGGGMGSMLGHYAFDNPVLGAVAGFSAPYSAAGANALMRTGPIRRVTNRIDRFYDHPRLSAENLALLNALSLGTTEYALDPTLSSATGR